MFLLELFVIGIPSFFLALQSNKELIRGNFIPYVIKKGLPYGLIIFANVITVLLLGKLNILNFSETESLATIVLTTAGFFNLVSLCYPYTLNKFLIVLSSLGGMILFGFIMPNFFGIVDVSTNVWKLALVLSLLTIVIHLVIKNINMLRKNHPKPIKINNIKRRR
jgi:cation-transporting ATPase E